MNRNLSTFLNLSRWLAAWLVLVGHVRHIVLVDLASVHQATLADKGLYFFTGLGHEAVVVFFVISGFLVGGTTLERWQQQGPDLKRYAIARFSRIYTVLVPALLVGLLMDVAGLRWFNASELYTNAVQYHTISLNSDISAGLDARTLLGNLCMLQGISTGIFGSNNPLWSLAYEWWYYGIFALLAAAWTGTGLGRWRLVSAMAGLLLAAWLPGHVTLWGGIWLLGLLTHRWIASGAWRPHPVVGLAVLALAIVWFRLNHNVENGDHPESLFTGFARDLVLGLAFSTSLASITRLQGTLGFSHFHARMADFSYTTYLCHFPAMLLLIAIAYQWAGLPFQLQPDLRGMAYLGGLSALLLAYCQAFAWLTERHTAAVQRWLQSTLAGPPFTPESQTP
ncbi:acyltransferase [Sphaerotilus sp.]|uniref:acyltransferase family protein n=1 Tax=Sphaerotilus sp. TaxID=2093942 RepID=UPI00286DCA1D|nr:acyltransferase [Sphaerotilus sp.]